MISAARRTLAIAAVALLGTAATAHAQVMQFQGITKGCFYTSSETSCATGSNSSVLFLDYTSSSFDVQSDNDGFASIGAAPAATNVNNLGSFLLGATPASYTGSNFLLDVVFSLPTIVSSPTVFSAALKGSVTAIAGGGVRIAFDPSTQVFDFENPDTRGQFTLTVNNVSITPGMTPVSLTGDISVVETTATPEPGTTALLATGLFGLVPVIRSRRKKTVA